MHKESNKMYAIHYKRVVVLSRELRKIKMLTKWVIY